MNHWALRITVLLSLGAIVNIAVAWGCCLLQIPVDHDDDPIRTYCERLEVEVSPKRAQAAIDKAFGMLDCHERARLAALGWKSSGDPWWHAHEKPPVAEPTFSLEAYNERAVGATWRFISETRWYGCSPAMHACADEVRAGLPLASLFGMRVDLASPTNRFGDHRRRARGPQWKRWGGWVVNDTGRYGYQRELLFPYRPLLPGFASNTVFYALVIWLLFAAPFALRRLRGRRRIRRGLCPKCSYDLRGSSSETCPECGTAHPMKP